MEELPKVSREQVDKQLSSLNTHVVGNDLTSWLNDKMTYLQQNNPNLYGYIFDRASKVATTFSMLDDPKSISVSVVVEWILLLDLVNRAMVDKVDTDSFITQMEKWFDE